MQKTSILVSDSETLVVDLLRNFLENDGGFVVRNAPTLSDTLDAMRAPQAPAITLVELSLPGLNGLSGFGRVLAAAPGSRIVLFSSQARPETIVKALQLGAAGYIPKSMPLNSLTNALKFIASGEIFVPSSVATLLLQESTSPGPEAANALSPKEMRILQGVCEGRTNKDIARANGMTEMAVKMTVRSICSKLNVRNRTQMAMKAVSAGLV